MGIVSAAWLIAALVCTFSAVRRLALLAFSCRRAGVYRVLHGVVARCGHVAKRVLSGSRLMRIRTAVQTRRRDRLIRAAMPEMLRLLCIALDAGSSLVMALEYAADNCDEPLAAELRRAVWDLKSGQGFDEAMTKLRRRTGSAEFSYLAVAMEVQHRSGGSLGSVLTAVSTSLRKTAELEDELAAQTAQGRLSARVVAIMPFAILAVLSMFSPGYLGQFFMSPLGVVLLVSALLLEGLGILLVRRVLAIDVSTGPLEEP